MLQLDDDTILLTGGKTNHTIVKDTWYFSINNETWARGPDMDEARWWHACSSFVFNTTVYAIVAGGFEGSKTVEFLDLSLEIPKWIPGPNLDFLDSYVYKVGHQLVSNGETLFYISTTDNLFFYLECDTIEECQWIQLNRQFENVRAYAIVALVPDTLTDCS